VVDLSHSCVVSNVIIEREIRRHDAAKKIYVVPVMSNFGEPSLSDLSLKFPNRWVICGGTALIERSLQTLGQIQKLIPPEFYPKEIEIVGGNASEGISRQLSAIKGAMAGASIRHSAEISAENASKLLAGCSFGWLDYFGTGKAWPGMIFKSGSFAAMCAHGIVPVLAHEEQILSLGSDPLPGPFFLTGKRVRFPERERLDETRTALQAWYDRNASSAHTAAVYAEALK
jgi:hypothetical protein